MEIREVIYNLEVLCHVASEGEDSHPLIGDMNCCVYRRQLGREVMGT